MSEAILTIACPTFNHEEYIKQCLDSLLMQKTTFSFKILIHDDASTDSTPNIIKDYHKRYPDIIIPIFQKINQHSLGIKNASIILPMIKTKYIAICEGDDYWTDPFKLQKQVDFLECNSEFNLCCTKALNLENDLLSNINPNRLNQTEYSLIDLYEYRLIATTCTVVYRNQIMPKWFRYDHNCIDIALFTALSLNSKIKMIDDVTAVYRIHNNGVWQGASIEKQIRDRLQLYYIVFPHVSKEIKTIIKEQINKIWMRDLIYLLTIDKSKFRKFFTSLIVRISYFKLFLRITLLNNKYNV